MGSTDRILHRFRVTEGIARGYDEKGDEIVSVPIQEPFYERVAFDEKIGAVRNNTP